MFYLQPCHVVYTEYRPTPLQHYIFPAGGDGIHLVVDEQVGHLMCLDYSCLQLCCKPLYGEIRFSDMEYIVHGSKNRNDIHFKLIL